MFWLGAHVVADAGHGVAEVVQDVVGHGSSPPVARAAVAPFACVVNRDSHSRSARILASDFHSFQRTCPGLAFQDPRFLSLFTVGAASRDTAARLA